ncbi:SRPBCC domain-containing protein [uncultured Roseibium sp.]|uniref:SRPBCC family protein n=1 Tax=uncultured Roseibium sp. TaxID=1936171 RepID=UPI0026354512|nr:SRPBCC domain-containing protein [uncultured Roseibium sp.]
MNDLSVVVSRIFPAPRTKVFEAWLDPQVLALFMQPCEGGPPATVTNDPVEGGDFEIIMRADDKEIPHRGVYKEINRHSRLAFTWESPFSLPDSVVTLDFKDVADGTELTLTHVKFPSEESRDGHEGGWKGILAALMPVLAESKAA